MKLITTIQIIFCLILIFARKTASQGIFFHSEMVNGKPEIVGTFVKDTAPPTPPNRSDGESKSAKFEIPLTTIDQEWLGSLLYLPQKKRVRKEYRELTYQERENLHLALNLLKNDTSVSLNKYDLLANVHARSSANQNAHSGPNFLGWHRVFILMMENALRQKVPTVTLPFWDVTLDEAMDKPYDSLIWSDEFMGSGDGPVRQGAFRNWETQFGYGHLRRLLAGQGKLMSSEDVERILSKRRLGDITTPGAEDTFNIEQVHNDVHVWIGGQMLTIEIAAFDPIFYLFHAFVDNLWTDFRQKQIADGIDPTNDYPEFYGLSTHSPFAPMSLGRVMVLDGISDLWNNNVTYTKRSTCNETYDGCVSKYIKCDISKRKCVAKSVNEVKNEVTPKAITEDTSSVPQMNTESIQNLYVSDIKLKTRPHRNGYKTLDSVYVRNSDVYLFYSHLTGNHEELTNMLLFIIYLKEFYLKDQYR